MLRSHFAGFDESVASLLQSSPDNTLVVLGEVKDVRKIRPFTKPMEMDFEILKVLNGKWDGRILTAKQGFRSENAYFEKYVPGKRYVMAFIREEKDDGSIFFAQSICGTYSKAAE